MLIGGFIKGDHTISSKTYLYNTKDFSFTLGPELTTGKRSTTCGTIDIDTNGRKAVIVAGGFTDADGTSRTNIVEGWPVDSPETDFAVWGHLSEPIAESAFATSSNDKSLVIAGGSTPANSNKIFSITCTEGSCKTREKSQSLRLFRSNSVAMFVQDSLATCN